MENIIAIAIIALVLGVAIGYIVRSKRRGDVCVGCPYAKQCGGKCGGGCGGANKTEDK